MGCDSGRLSCALAADDRLIYGIDISSPLIKLARARATKKRLTEATHFTSKDFRFADFNGGIDLVIFWDSTINIWPKHQMLAIIRKAYHTLSQEECIIIQQLNPDFFLLHNNEISFELQDKNIGPGKTKRRYVFNEDTGILLDHVTYLPGKGKAEVLPIQKLYLPKPNQLIQLLISAGFTKINSPGSDGWNWSKKIIPIKQNSAQLAIIGCK